MKAKTFLDEVVIIYFNHNCTVPEAILLAIKKLRLSDLDVKNIKKSLI